MEKLDWEAPELDLPDNCIPTGEVRIVEYLDEDGDEAYGYALSAGMRRSSVIGMLYMVSHIQAHKAEDDDFGGDE